MALDYKKLASVLTESELLTRERLAEAERRSRERNVPLEEVLVEREFISDENLGQIIADICSVPFVSLKKKSIDEQALKIVPEIVAKRQRIIAFERGSAGIKLAMADPGNEEIVNFLAKKTGERILRYYATAQDIKEALVHYRKSIADEFDTIISDSIIAAKGATDSAREQPATQIVASVLEYAYHNKASDIHIEPHEASVAIRFRIDGILHDVVTLPKEIQPYIITRIKILSKLRTDEHRAAQDGRLEFTVDDGKVDTRVSIVPVSDGEKVVMRILSEKSRLFGLPELGLESDDLDKVERGFKKPYGMILATGPTGSGKTTTLYAVLKILNTREVNIATIEDPVEYDIEGVNQIQVNPKTNLTFADGLRSILRQDPDIVMVGEIRDEETASIAINAAMTGHLVLSTLHTNDAPTTLPRLIDMKIEPFLIASTVNVAIAQRLVRKVHQGCMESYLPSEDELRRIRDVIGGERFAQLGMDKRGFRLYRGRGCKLCSNTGYEGRIAIFEVLEMTEAIRRLIMKQANSDEIRTAALHEGMTTMLDDGLHKAIRGVTTIEEVFRVSTE
ncbi:MAG: ATPase, T2SS/T4P/T4SS family [Patescibacteria group bacterium]